MKKNVRDYKPGLNDFLHFAEVMNLNAELDMKQAQGTKNALPEANVAATADGNGGNTTSYADVLGRYRGVLGGSVPTGKKGV